MTTPNSTRGQGTSMLDAMVTATAEAKAKAAGGQRASLTPLPGEGTTGLVAAPAPLIPNHPTLGTLPEDPDIIIGRLKEARREAVEVVASIDRLLVMWGQPEEVVAQRIATERALTEREEVRREADRRVAASAGPQASKADQAAAARAQARIDAEQPIVDKAALLKAMMEEPVIIDEAGQKPLEQFTAEFEAMKEAAQAATFGPGTALPNMVTTAGHELIETPAEAAAVQQAVTAADGWVCPKHGGFVPRKSERRQIEFRACPEQGCGEFEKK